MRTYRDMARSFSASTTLEESRVAPASAAADVVGWCWLDAGTASGAAGGVLIHVRVSSRHFVGWFRFVDLGW